MSSWPRRKLTRKLRMTDDIVQLSLRSGSRFCCRRRTCLFRDVASLASGLWDRFELLTGLVLRHIVWPYHSSTRSCTTCFMCHYLGRTLSRVLVRIVVWVYLSYRVRTRLTRLSGCCGTGDCVAGARVESSWCCGRAMICQRHRGYARQTWIMLATSWMSILRGYDFLLLRLVCWVYSMSYD